MNRTMQKVQKAAVAAVVMVAVAMSLNARPAQADDSFPWLIGNPGQLGGRLGLTFAALRPRVLVTYGLMGPRLHITFVARRAR
jgi:hypothetical protein